MSKQTVFILKGEMKVQILFALAWILSQSLLTENLPAQIVNMHSALSGKVEDGLHAELVGRNEEKSGNTDLDRFTALATVTYKREADLWLFTIKRQYSSEDDVSSSDSRFYHLRYRYFLDGNWSLEAFGQEDADRFRRSLRRVVYGLGPRYQVDWSRLSLAASSAYMHEDQEYGHDANGIREPSRITSRVSNILYLGYDLSEWGLLENVTYFQPEIGKIKNHRTLNSLSLTFAINRHLSYRLSHTLEYNARPAIGIQKTDRSVDHSLVLKF